MPMQDWIPIVISVIALFVSFWSLFQKRPRIYIKTITDTIIQIGGSENYSQFFISNKGLYKTTIRNVCVLVYNVKTKKAKPKPIPVIPIKSGGDVDFFDITKGLQLGPGQQWCGYVKQLDNMFDKNTRTYLHFHCSHKNKPIKKRFKRKMYRV